MEFSFYRLSQRCDDVTSEGEKLLSIRRAETEAGNVKGASDGCAVVRRGDAEAVDMRRQS